METTYNKLFAAIISTLITRWLLRWSGVDVDALGVSEDFKMLVALGIDSVVAGVNGFFVWWLPYRQRLRDWIMGR